MHVQGEQVGKLPANRYIIPIRKLFATHIQHFYMRE